MSAGDRDADADDVSGMSASKMRMFAEKGDFESFEKVFQHQENDLQRISIKKSEKEWVLQKEHFLII